MSLDIPIPEAEALYLKLKNGIAAILKQHSEQNTYLVGIYSGGAWLAERLKTDLQLDNPVGLINTSLYRDDFRTIGLHYQTLPSYIPFNIDEQHLILIDDILFTGRSVRAAINELFDYGRPASISLAVLLDRGGRELPIQADVCGAVIQLEKDNMFVLSQSEEHIFDIDLVKVA